jgi:RNA-directed DNA polymerase
VYHSVGKRKVQVAMNKPKLDSVQLNTEGWKTVNWRKAQRYVFKLQKRIYAASRRGDVKRCRKLQHTLMRSWYNRLLSVRRVTQENLGKKTAGVDGVKSLSPEARMKLARELKPPGNPNPHVEYGYQNRENMKNAHSRYPPCKTVHYKP